MAVTLYEVGGCVRDDLLGIKTKDIDYTAVVHDDYANDPMAELRRWLEWNNFEIFTENEEFFTIRAHFPKGMTEYGGRNVSKLTADFVLARKEGEYSDGRRPDYVTAGTLEDDLRRRDFTVNAIAKDSAGKLIDPHDGLGDLEKRTLRAVGNVEDRLREDALRALRAIRFKITKGFYFDHDLLLALHSEWLPPLLANVSVERRQQELFRAFRHDTLATMELLSHEVSPEFVAATFNDGLWLMPTLKGVK